MSATPAVSILSREKPLSMTAVKRAVAPRTRPGCWRSDEYCKKKGFDLHMQQIPTEGRAQSFDLVFDACREQSEKCKLRRSVESSSPKRDLLAKSPHDFAQPRIDDDIHTEIQRDCSYLPSSSRVQRDRTKLEVAAYWHVSF